MILKTVPEVAAQLRLSDRAIYDLCRAGKLRHLRLGAGKGSIRVSQEDLDAYREACVTGGDGGDQEGA
ncbi:MAG: helix-turn-helix domain-containing protein [Planctomycetales bacterium]